MENRQIFRQKSLDRVSSPEDLNTYIRVANPGIWILLIAIIVLLVGALIWGAVVSFETKTVDAAAVVRNGRVSLYLTEESRGEVKEGMHMTVGEDVFELPELEMSAAKLFEDTDSAVMRIIGATTDEYVYVAKFYIDLPNGVYAAKIAAEEVSPTGLIIN